MQVAACRSVARLSADSSPLSSSTIAAMACFSFGSAELLPRLASVLIAALISVLTGLMIFMESAALLVIHRPRLHTARPAAGQAAVRTMPEELSAVCGRIVAACDHRSVRARKKTNG